MNTHKEEEFHTKFNHMNAYEAVGHSLARVIWINLFQFSP